MKCILPVSFAIIATITASSSYAGAETREQCKLNQRPQTMFTVSTGVGGLAGGAVGAAACSGFLVTVIFDLGISYAACLATFTLAGTVVGAAVAEGNSNEELKKCEALPSG